ncbi:MAG: hypothetical protein P8Q92_17305 [Pseudoprimorskyibacter sp.]|nr:hypothetical protein [Pseudoprimorskyibacter sp.]
MSYQYWLEPKHLKRIQHLFPKPVGVARANERKALSGIIHLTDDQRSDFKGTDVLLKNLPKAETCIGYKG